ncbi:MAG: glycosyltransferase family 39 protein [Candidatus Sumerlaeia bacterium]
MSFSRLSPDPVLNLFRENPFAVVAAAAGVLFMIRFVALALLRVGYPYQLEWIEGMVLIQVQRVLNGEPMFVEPSIRYIPCLYTPLYFYVSAAAAWVMGLGFLPLRLVSFISTLVTFAIIFDFVRRETGRAWPGLIAAGLLAAAFDKTGLWMDIARVDSLFLCLTFAFVYVLHFYGARHWGWAVAAGVLGGMAFLTKQTAAPILALMTVYELAFRPRRIWPAPAVAAIVVAAALGWFQWRSGGWFGYYAFEMMSGHGILREYLVAFWTVDLKSLFPIGLLIAAGAPPLLWLQRGWKSALFHALLAVSLIITAWTSRMHIGGWTNVLIPAVAALSILTGIAAGLAATQPRLNRKIAWLLCLAIGFQFWALHMPEADAVPTAEDRKAGEKFEKLMAELPGDVFAPGQGYIAARVGKTPFVHTATSIDVLRGPDCPARRKYNEEVATAIRTKRFGAIVSDTYPRFFGFEDEIAANYKMGQSIYPTSDAFFPVTGVPMRPEVILTRRPTSPTAASHPPAPLVKSIFE